MRLKTIWTISAMSFKERRRRSLEWLEMKIASYLPRRIRYWAIIVETNRFSRENPTIEVPTIHAFDLLDSFEEK